MDQSLSPKPEEKAATADQTPDAQPVPDEVAASEHEEAEQSPFEDQGELRRFFTYEAARSKKCHVMSN